ncbi:MAG TPA: peptidylprolyl isomerase [Chryseosolibacter sp.]|nr:peptidylprolyl isomerase [Chryseosolibacter sp.]
MMKVLLTLLVFITFSHLAVAQKKDFVVTIQTRFGDMIVLLHDETPQHKANFIKLAKEHYYDSLLFHRVISDFMIQGGDPESKRAKSGERLGNGGPGYTVPAEFNPKFFHEKGALAAARMGDNANPTKASSGSQFYIVQGKKFSEIQLRIDQQKLNTALLKFRQIPENKAHVDSLNAYSSSKDNAAYEDYIKKIVPLIESQQQVSLKKEIIPSEEVVKAYTTVGGTPHLDGSYTVFGKVIKGIEVLDKIATVPVDRSHRPLEDIKMMISVDELPKKKIEKRYGFKYPAKEKIKKKK